MCQCEIYQACRECVGDEEFERIRSENQRILTEGDDSNGNTKENE